MIARRELVASGALLALTVRPARATPEAMAAAIHDFTGGTPPRPGRVSIDIPPLVENGNAVPVTVAVEGPMSAADHVVAIGLFTPRNPLPEVARFRLGPRAGRALVGTRMRLATSQPVVAVARLADGSCWSHAVEVEVTLAACVE